MTETVNEAKVATGRDYWRERIAEQERSGMSVRRFCKEQGIGEHLVYYWRKRVRDQQQPMRFALVETSTARPEPATEPGLELLLRSGERLRIGAGVDLATLRAVLEALRA